MDNIKPTDKISVKKPCGVCKGSKILSDAHGSTIACQTCGGRGEISVEVERSFIEVPVSAEVQ
ncbi:MAG: hypothetical protein R3321_04645 [Nitrososphaeraceae archaeon]|nr:hypothetical protein [Nitrososphaeraceae archaeon]